MKIAVLIIAIISLEATVLAQPNAEALYTEGQAAYNRADYATATAKWQASYDLSKESGLLFNLAQAKRLSGDCAGALVTYRRFIATDADDASEQHKLANDLMRELEGTCSEREPAVTPPPKIKARLGTELNLAEGRSPRKSDGPRPGRTWKIAGLITSGAGVVTIALGLGLGHHGSSIGDEVTAACATSCDWAAQKAKDARGRREAAIGKALDVVGMAAIAGGAVMYYLGSRESAVTVSPRGHADGAIVSWSGSW